MKVVEFIFLAQFIVLAMNRGSREPTKYPLSMLSFHERGQMGEPFSAP